MATTDEELETEVRNFTDIGVDVVDEAEFQTVLNDAKRHIIIKRRLTDEEIDWYGDTNQEDALNWTTKLFLMVAAEKLDSPTVQVGAIDKDSLLAKNDNQITEWFRKMQGALSRVKPVSSYGLVSPARRDYETEETTGGSLV